MSIQPTDEPTRSHPTHPNPPAARADALVATEKKKCDHCYMIIVWARTDPTHDAVKMPVDAKPMPPGEGNVVLSAHDTWGLIAGVVQTKGRRNAMQAAGWTFYQHHRLSCPYASRWTDKPDSGRKPAKTYKRRSRT